MALYHLLAPTLELRAMGLESPSIFKTYRARKHGRSDPARRALSGHSDTRPAWVSLFVTLDAEPCESR